MHKSFNLTEHTDVRIPMYGTTHLIRVTGLLLLLLIILWQKENVKKLVANWRFIKNFMFGYLLLEVLYWSLTWGYRIDPLYELGPNNPLEVPFLSASFTVWPWSFPSFAVVGVILLHQAYLGFKWLEKAERPVEMAV